MTFIHEGVEYDSNMTYEIEVVAGSKAEVERVMQHYRDYGHYVSQTSDTSVVLIGGAKVVGIAQREFAGMPCHVHMLSKPVGFQRGEWVAIPRIGLVGQIGWEYGHSGRHTSDYSRTSASVSIGSATWTVRADLLVRLSDLSADEAAELLTIGQAQAGEWETLREPMQPDHPLMPARNRVLAVAGPHIA